MDAAYDSYDYPSYWIGRDYEHKSEVYAIKKFLEKITYLDTILEIGSGYGRLTPSYINKAKKIILSDPSKTLLQISKDNFKKFKVKCINSEINNLHKNIKKQKIDLIIFIRVMHHIKNIDNTFININKLLKKNGYLLLEFANKRHLKATFSELLKGNFTFPLDIFPKDLRSKKSKLNNCLPFYNFHPDIIFEKLKKHGFEIIDKRSVSNIRSTKIKNFLSTDSLLFFEKILQKPLSFINFGPSMFILATKK